MDSVPGTVLLPMGFAAMPGNGPNPEITLADRFPVSFLRYFLDKQKVANNSPMFFVYESILPFVLIQKVVPKNQGGINPLAKNHCPVGRKPNSHTQTVVSVWSTCQ